MSAKSRLGRATNALARADGAVIDRMPDGDGQAADLLALPGKLGDQPPLRLACAAMIGAGLAGRRPRLARAGFRMLVAHELATLAKTLVKRRIDRHRPARSGSRQSRPRQGGSRAKADTSFPSGHSAGASAAGLAFAREFPEQRAAALAVTALLAGAQVPRRAHYPSDVAAGLLIGALAERAIAALWPAQRRAGRLASPPAIQ